MLRSLTAVDSTIWENVLEKCLRGSQLIVDGDGLNRPGADSHLKVH